MEYCWFFTDLLGQAWKNEEPWSVFNVSSRDCAGAFQRKLRR